MRRVALLFPGQGAQYAGMAADLYHSFPTARKVIDTAAELVADHMDLRDLMFHGPEDQIKRTSVCQPAVVAHSQAVFSVLNDEIPTLFQWAGAQRCPPIDLPISFPAVMGHSVGEFSAASVMGCIPFDTALRTVALRGRLMENIANDLPNPHNKPFMRSMLLSSQLTGGIEDAPFWTKVQDILEDVQSQDEGVVDVALVNSSRQVVLSGTPDAVEKACHAARAAGIARRYVSVQTGGPFHSRLMTPVKNELVDLLAKVSVQCSVVPFISCASTAWVEDADDIQQAILDQTDRTVQWWAATRALAEAYPPNMTVECWELGPGSFLSSTVKSQYENCQTRTLGKVEELEGLIAELRSL